MSWTDFAAANGPLAMFKENQRFMWAAELLNGKEMRQLADRNALPDNALLTTFLVLLDKKGGMDKFLAVLQNNNDTVSTVRDLEMATLFWGAAKDLALSRGEFIGQEGPGTVFLDSLCAERYWGVKILAKANQAGTGARNVKNFRKSVGADGKEVAAAAPPDPAEVARLKREKMKASAKVAEKNGGDRRKSGVKHGRKSGRKSAKLKTAGVVTGAFTGTEKAGPESTKARGKAKAGPAPGAVPPPAEGADSKAKTAAAAVVPAAAGEKAAPAAKAPAPAVEVAGDATTEQVPSRPVSADPLEATIGPAKSDSLEGTIGPAQEPGILEANKLVTLRPVTDVSAPSVALPPVAEATSPGAGTAPKDAADGTTAASPPDVVPDAAPAEEEQPPQPPPEPPEPEQFELDATERHMFLEGRDMEYESPFHRMMDMMGDVDVEKKFDHYINLGMAVEKAIEKAQLEQEKKEAQAETAAAEAAAAKKSYSSVSKASAAPPAKKKGPDMAKIMENQIGSLVEMVTMTTKMNGGKGGSSGSSVTNEEPRWATRLTN